MTVIQMRDLVGSDKIDGFGRILDDNIEGSEVVLDFAGLMEIPIPDSIAIMRTCLDHQGQGITIRIRNMSMPVRERFLLSGISHGGDEFLL